MQEVVDYIMIQGNFPKNVTKEVKKAIADGYQPLGPPLLAREDGVSWYVQAMVKYDCGIAIDFD